MATLDQTAIAQIWKSCAGDCAVCCAAQPQALLTHILQSSPPPLSNVLPRCRIVQSKTRPLHHPPFGSPRAQPFLARLPGICTAMFARHAAPSSSRLKTAQTRDNGCLDAKVSGSRHWHCGWRWSRHPQFRLKNAAVAQHRAAPRCCLNRCSRWFVVYVPRMQQRERKATSVTYRSGCMTFVPPGRRAPSHAASVDAEPHVARKARESVCVSRAGANTAPFWSTGQRAVLQYICGLRRPVEFASPLHFDSVDAERYLFS
jgi:hypothetical protein